MVKYVVCLRDVVGSTNTCQYLYSPLIRRIQPAILSIQPTIEAMVSTNRLDAIIMAYTSCVGVNTAYICHDRITATYNWHNHNNMIDILQHDLLEGEH